MAKKSKVVFYCQNCGHQEQKWLGQCPVCREWNTFAEEVEISSGTAEKRGSQPKGRAVPLSKVQADDQCRIQTGIQELDRVLGGGIVPGALVLVGGDPGIGKSTLLLQMARELARERSVLYVSGEESPTQIKLRANRIGDFSENLALLCETHLDTVREVVETQKPELVILDSIQTMYSDDVSSAAGSVSQIRTVTGICMQLAKSANIPIFLIGHVTKEGTVAGPRVLEHMVDTVLYFEGDRYASYRILRAVKNRFGSTNEIGMFEMRQDGLMEVSNPSEYMLSGKAQHAAGSVVVCAMEGTRPLLLEVQALVCRSNFGLPRRTATGTDYNRVNVLMAVLEKRGGLQLGNCDAYVNIAGGIRVNEPAIDLGIVMALASGYKNHSVDEKMLVFGEVGLGGEVRGVSTPQLRVNEAKKLGFEVCVLPEASKKMVSDVQGIRLIGVKTIGDVLQLL